MLKLTLSQKLSQLSKPARHNEQQPFGPKTFMCLDIEAITVLEKESQVIQQRGKIKKG